MSNKQTQELEAIAQLQQTAIGFPISQLGSYGDGTAEGGSVPPKLDALTGLPSNHIPLDAFSSVPVGAVGVETTVVSYLVQNGYDAIITRYSCNYLAGGFAEGSGDLVWRIAIDGRPVKNFDNITTQRGSLQIPRDITDLRVYSGQTLTFTCTSNNVALTGNTACSFVGYTYPSQGN